jgi:hypothetical protein
VKLEVDHVIPAVDGGPDTAENLVTACYACNRGKAAHRLWQFQLPRLEQARLKAKERSVLSDQTLIGRLSLLMAAEPELDVKALAARLGATKNTVNVLRHRLRKREAQDALDVTS